MVVGLAELYPSVIQLVVGCIGMMVGNGLGIYKNINLWDLVRRYVLLWILWGKDQGTEFIRHLCCPRGVHETRVGQHSTE